MPLLTATDKPICWAVEYNGKVVITDIAPIGGKIGIPPTLTYQSDTDENAFLGKVAGKGSTYQPLAPGRIKAGEIRGWNGGLVIARQEHDWTGVYTPDQTPALWMVYRPTQTGPMDWIAGEPVEVGALRVYNAKTYKCLQKHVTQNDWTPPAVPALWAQVAAPDAPWASGVAYKVGDYVTYSGTRYQCLQAHTSQVTWTPPAVPALWKKV